MRKTLNINLGGMAFIIDENAFELMHNYLEALKLKFNNEAERAEIMNDIEARIGEMLSQRLDKSKEVIGVDDVTFVTNAMGRPEDIAGEESAEGTTESTQATNSAPSAPVAPVKKRLFRDPDDAKIGGVIAGLCHYFGIEDPVWVRIAALILIFFTSGTLILVYILLLVIVPKAQTAAEKLQMKGEPVNIHSIEKEIKEAANRAGESVHNFVTEQNIFERLWEATLSVLKVFLKMFALVDIFVSMILLIVVAACFFAFYAMGASQYQAASHLIVDSASTLHFFSVGFLLFVATPLIALIYLGLKILLGQRSRVRWLKVVLFAGWFIGLIMLIVTGIKIGTNFSVTGTSKQDLVLMQPSHNNLYVQLTDLAGKKVSKDWEDNMPENFYVNEQGEIIINGTELNDLVKVPLGRPTLQLMASENDSFYIQEITNSQGRSTSDAIANAKIVQYPFSQTDSVLNLTSLFYIEKTGKFRGQSMKIRIAIPNGKTIHFADNIDLWRATVKGDANYDDTYFANTTWTVENGKVKCIEGENHKNAGEKIDAPEPPAKPAPPVAPAKPSKDKDSDGDKEDKDEKGDSDKDF